MDAIARLKIIIIRLKAYKPEKRVEELLKTDEVQFAILNLIRERIYRKGVLASGEKLITDSARYQPGQKAYSIRNKKKRNRSHVDLYVTGDFYESMELRVGASVTKLIADNVPTIHENFQDMFRTPAEMIDEIGTLTEEEVDIVSKKVIMPYIEEDLKQIFNVQMS